MPPGNEAGRTLVPMLSRGPYILCGLVLRVSGSHSDTLPTVWVVQCLGGDGVLLGPCNTGACQGHSQPGVGDCMVPGMELRPRVLFDNVWRHYIRMWLPCGA